MHLKDLKICRCRVLTRGACPCNIEHVGACPRHNVEHVRGVSSTRPHRRARAPHRRARGPPGRGAVAEGAWTTRTWPDAAPPSVDARKEEGMGWDGETYLERRRGHGGRARRSEPVVEHGGAAARRSRSSSTEERWSPVERGAVVAEEETEVRARGAGRGRNCAFSLATGRPHM